MAFAVGIPGHHRPLRKDRWLYHRALCNLNYYCDGTWQGLIDHLDYIQDMGFTAVWISPIVKNIEGNTPDGSSYHGFWAEDIYAVNQHFGTPADLKALSQALHDRGMYLMIDVVVNHMAYWAKGNLSAIDYSTLKPFNSSDYYHPYCPIDYNNATSILECYQGSTNVPLLDLKTENATVQAIWNSWIKEIIENYSVDGLRIDSLQQSGSFFFPSFTKAANGTYMVGEDFNGDPTQVCPYQRNISGLLNFPMYYYITQAFQESQGSIGNLANGITTMQSLCKDVTLLGSFSENHDVARFPSITQDIARAMNVIAFTIMADGIPMIYQGQEQHFDGSGVPVNREALWLSGYNTTTPLYKLIGTVNKVRQQAILKKPRFVVNRIRTIYTDDHTIVTRKGLEDAQVIGVYSNFGANGAYYNLTLNASSTGYSKNQKVMEVVSCTLLRANKEGDIVVPMGAGQPKILFVQKQLKGSGVCEQYTTEPATPVSTPSCQPASILFKELVNTTYGENIVLVGNSNLLRNWTPADGIPLSADNYTVANPLWYVNVSGFDPQSVIQYKYVKLGPGTAVRWEEGPNHTFEIPGPACTPTATLEDVWQG